MKKITLLIFLFSTIFINCRLQPKKLDESNSPEEQVEVKLQELTLDHLQLLELEGCEYLIFKDGFGNKGFGYMTHKGNCKNPIHCYNNIDTLKNQIK